MCFITRDRTLIREIATKIIQVRVGQVTVFSGNYDDYLWQSTRSDTEVDVVETQVGVKQLRRPSITVTKRQRKALEGRLRNEHYRDISPVNQRIAEIEKEVTVSIERIEEIEAMWLTLLIIKILKM